MPIKKDQLNFDPDRIIDLSGPSGNAYNLLGLASKLCEQLEPYNEKYSADVVLEEMKSGNYDHLVNTFEKYFGEWYTLVTNERKYED